jgi:hypothetical protein
MSKSEELKAIATAPGANRFFPNSEISAIENCGNPQRLEELAADPAHGARVEPKGLHEAVIGLALEEKGDLVGAITRDPRPDGGEFIDGQGKVWDVKSFRSGISPKKGGFELKKDLDKIDNELQKGEGVIVDTTFLSPSDAATLRQGVQDRGWSNNQVKWYP